MVQHIMTETLPTVVGMGVTSRTVETMFGKGKGKGRKVKIPTRKIGGKVYQEANWHTTKAAAEKDASYFRKNGHSARVMRYYNARMKRWGYMVYVR